jgi:hypothetical protein
LCPDRGLPTLPVCAGAGSSAETASDAAACHANAGAAVHRGTAACQSPITRPDADAAGGAAVPRTADRNAVRSDAGGASGTRVFFP